MPSKDISRNYQFAAEILLRQRTVPLLLRPLNPRQVRDFAKATGKRAKTDALDAAVLAHFAEAIQPSVSTIADEDSQHMAEF